MRIVSCSDDRKGLLRSGQLCFETSFRRFRRTILERTCFLGGRRLSLETLSRVRRHERQSAPALRRASHSRASKLSQKVYHHRTIALPPFVATHCRQVFYLLVFSQLMSQLTAVHYIAGRPQIIACSRKNLSQRSGRVHADIYGN